MGSDTWGSYDPAAGVLMADKALKTIWTLFKKSFVAKINFTSIVIKYIQLKINHATVETKIQDSSKHRRFFKQINRAWPGLYF